MKRRTAPSQTSFFRPAGLLSALLLVCATARPAAAEPPPAALTAFNSYVSAVELRLAQQHRSQANFLAGPASSPQSQARLRQGELIVEQLTPSGGRPVPGALLHHWRGTAFAPGASAADFDRLMQNFAAYPRHFAPEVLRASAVALPDGSLRASMRVQQKHVLTVVMDSDYEVRFAHLDALHGYSISRSTQIAEIGSPGTAQEHVLDASQEHGFLWRLNTYWSYEQRDGGLYLQVESVSLTRAIPRGLGWAIQPFILSIPRDSLEFALRSVCAALRDQSAKEQTPYKTTNLERTP